MTDAWVVSLAVALLCAVAVCLAQWLRYRRNINKVKFMFDSIDSNDFSFNFATSDVSDGDKLMNESLNRIKQLLQRARDEALEREKYYEQIIDLADTGIMVVNAKGNVLLHNHAAERLLGVDVLTHIDQVRSNLESGSLSRRESFAVLKGKKVRIISLSNIDSELSNREVDSWVKLIRVLTHEIMNTVTPITSLSATLLKNAEGEQRGGLEVINKTGKELIAFVENYRKFTHVPAPQPKLFYVRPFVERMASLTGRNVAVSVEPHDMMLYADESLVARVVTNLLKNAVQATEAGGQIWINAYCTPQDAVVIDIVDNGGLIPDDVAQHIFVPFFTTKKEGSGIGLSLSRQIMRNCGGTISLKQDKKKGETTFELVFP